ncbi:hypothetical protein F4780DRAFT_775782 [Xylariomycetidae sp. FL0641]|nr:hypothetical protein F4780DRAFT_775782 [Xylariomycetidae sp. FL0641]
MASSQPAHRPAGDSGEMNYKQQLDKVALKAKHPSDDATNNQGQASIVDKVAEYIPGAAKILGGGGGGGGGGGKPEEQTPEEKEDGPPQDVPPLRPVHDEHIEDFVRAQHRSRPFDGVDKSGS